MCLVNPDLLVAAVIRPVMLNVRNGTKSFTIIELKQMFSGKGINQKLSQVPVFSIHVYQC